MRAYLFFLMLAVSFLNIKTFAATDGSFQTNLKLRESKKVGLGASFNGLSSAAIHLELNFEDQDGVIAGFGSGIAYNSFQLQWKHHFEGQYLTPYTTLGVSHWYNTTNTATIRKNYVLNSALTSQQKESGRYDVDFLVGAVGLQYNQLSGDFVGASFFGELQALLSLEKTGFSPAGSIGVLYYF